LGITALGRRQSKLINGTSAQYLYDGLIPVQDIGTSATANLLTELGIDAYLTHTDAVGTRTLLTDAVGTTVALADDTGVVQSEYTYPPFGAANETGPDANSFQYTGRENDVTGLYYHRARYYDPAIGSFISEDPVGFAGSGPNLMPTFTTVLQTQFDPFGLADSASPWQVGLEWLSGGGPTRHDFTNGDQRGRRHG